MTLIDLVIVAIMFAVIYTALRFVRETIFNFIEKFLVRRAAECDEMTMDSKRNTPSIVLSPIQ